MNIQDGLLYTEHDEWVKVDGDVVTVGITDFAQDQLGEIVHIELPDVGTQVAPGDRVCEVESVKAVAEVYTPVGGEVIEVNEALSGAEDQINNDPYGAWMFRIRATSAPAGLLDAEGYRGKVG